MGAVKALGLGGESGCNLVPLLEALVWYKISVQPFLCMLCLKMTPGNAAYRKAALEHHPDKAGAAIADEDTKSAIEEKFKAIQEAYETLSDPAKRREFDSTDDFDDTLPADCAPEDFLKASLAHLRPSAAQQSVCSSHCGVWPASRIGWEGT